MTAEPIRISNPHAFLIHEIATLTLNALDTSPLVQDSQAALLDLAGFVHDPRLGFFVAKEGDRFTAVAIAEHNTRAVSPGCFVMHFYNKGSDDARKCLVEALAAFARDCGHSQIWGFDVNQSGGAFARLFKVLGTATTHGTLWAFDLTEGEV